MMMNAEKIRKTHHPEEAGREWLPAEENYVKEIKDKVLGLTDKEVISVNYQKLNFPKIVNSLPLNDKNYFASVFYGLACIRKDRASLGMVEIVAGDMSNHFTLEWLAKQNLEVQSRVDNNPYMG